MKKFALFFLSLGFLVACASTYEAQLQNRALHPYDSKHRIAHKVVHSDKSTFVWIETSLPEYTVQLLAFDDFKPNLKILDKTETVNNSGNQKKSFLLEFSTPPAALVYGLEIRVTNQKLGVNFKDIVLVNPNQENEQHIFLTDTSNTPLSRNYLPINTIARLSYKNDSVQQFYVKYFSESQNPAYPAQSQNKSFFNPLKDYDNLYIIPRGKNFSFVRRGVYFVQTDSNSNKGAFVNVVPEDYPKTTTAEELLEALRYITTNKEYEQILNASNQKQELDNFWLQRAPNGNKEIARNQLRLYYQRVEESNFYFTSFKEGWKTDKGVIYIIFGRPHTIRKYSNKEVWYYRSNSQRPPTEFVFTRVGEQYTLERHPSYKDFWDTEIRNWRAGLARD